MVPGSTTRFSNRVEDYVKYRPGYPAEIISYLQAEHGLTKDNLIADIGAGTGISSGLFLKAGYQVIAVEPNKDMREKSIELLSAYPTFKAVDGTAEQTTLADNSIDLIVSGQAFHWFHQGKAKTEFKRILQPDGLIALIWNERKMVSPFEKEYEALIVKHARNYQRVSQRNIDAEHIAVFFCPAPFQLKIFPNQQLFNYEGLLGRLLSSSYMPARNDESFKAMNADLEKLFDKYQESGSIVIEYDTKVYTGKMD